MNVRQPEVTALEAIRELLMVHTKQMQDRGVEIMNVNRLIDNVVAEIVGLAVNLSAFDATTRHPHREVARVMVTAVVFLRQRPLAIYCAAKFSAPDHQSIVQHSSLLQILHQRRARAIAGGSHSADRVWQSAVMIPATQEDLSKRDASFRHSSCQQAVVGECSRLFDFRPVHIEHALRLVGNIGQVRDRCLHAECHLVLRNT